MKKLIVAVVALAGVSSLMAGNGRTIQNGLVAVNDTVCPDTTAGFYTLITANDTVCPDTTKALVAANDTVSPDTVTAIRRMFLA